MGVCFSFPSDSEIVTNDQFIQFHDDGEDSLGPHIITWSLGCPAVMKIRMKYKHFSGFSTTGKIYHPEFPVPSDCFRPEERLKLNEMAATMTADELNAEALKVLKGCPRKAPVIIELKLRHGDFMSMHGAQMQVLYEVSHCVTPCEQI